MSGIFTLIKPLANNFLNRFVNGVGFGFGMGFAWTIQSNR